MTFGIVGLGIMGGSLAKSIRTNILSMSNSTGRILACNRSVSSLEMAKSEGVIDEGYASDCVEKMLPELLDACSKILSKKPMFVLMTLYSIEASSIMASNMLAEYFGKRKNAKIECGELAIKSTNGYDLPLSLYAKATFDA